MNDISTTLTAFAEVDPTRGELTWQRLVNEVEAIGLSVGPLSQNVAFLYKKGKLTPDLAKAYVEWITSANATLNAVADLIEQNPDLRDAIDAAGGSQVADNGLGSMLGGVVRPSSEVISLLRGPLPAITPGVLTGLSGSPAALAEGITRFSGAAWNKLLELLKNRGVIAIGATAVVAQKAGELVGSDADLEAKRQARYMQIYNAGIAAGLDPDAASEMALRVVSGTKTGEVPFLWLAGGAAGLGLLLFWMKRQGVTVVVPRGGDKS